MDNTGFAELLVKLYQLESRTSTKSKVADERDFLRLSESISNSAIPGLIGKTGFAKSNKVFFDGKYPVVFYIREISNFKSIQVLISDKKGNIICEIPEQKQVIDKPGYKRITWSGEAVNQKKLRAGEYFINTIAIDNSGNEIKIDSFISGKIERMEFVDAGVFFEIGKIRVSYEELLEIYS